MFSCLWPRSSSSIWNFISFFFISHKQIQQQRPAAPGISRVPRGARGSLGTGLLYRQCINTRMHTDFLCKTFTQVEKEHTHKHYSHANISTDTPTHPHMPHAVSGFHVLCPDFWLVPTSKQGALVYFLAASKYFTQCPFMLEIWAMWEISCQSR